MSATSPRRMVTTGGLLAATVLATLLTVAHEAAGNDGAAAPAVIPVWLGDYPIPGYLDQRKALAKTFNEQHPEYEVRVEAHPYDKLPADVAAAVAQGKGPALANYYYNATRQAMDLRTPAGRPVFTPVESAIRGRTRILGVPVVTGDLLPNVRATYSEHGRLLAQPITSQTSVMFANRPMLAKAGITEMPRTWQELTADCERLTTMPGGPKHCVTWLNHNWFFQQAVAQQGGVLVDHQNGRAGRAATTELAAPPVLRYAQWWKSMKERGYYYYAGEPEEYRGTSKAFVTGDVAFMMDSSNQGVFIKTPFQKMVAGLPTPRPTGRGRGVPNIASGDALWLRDGLSRREQDGALAFAQFLSSPDALASFTKKTGYLPVTRSGVRELSRGGWLAEHPEVRAATERIASAPTRPRNLAALTGAFDQIQRQLLLAMDDVLDGGAPVRDRFRQAQRTADRHLAVYNALCQGPAAHPKWCYSVGAGG